MHCASLKAARILLPQSSRLACVFFVSLRLGLPFTLLSPPSLARALSAEIVSRLRSTSGGRSSHFPSPQPLQIRLPGEVAVSSGYFDNEIAS